MKCNCKQINFLWFLLLSTPFMFYFHSYTPTSTPSPRISNLIPCISTPIPQFPALILCIPHIPTLVLHILTPISRILTLIPWIPTPFPPFPISTPLYDSTFWLSQMVAKIDISTSSKTLSTSCRSSIKLSRLSHLWKIPKKKFNFSNLAGLQPVILLEIELNHGYFSFILSIMLNRYVAGIFLLAASVTEILACV